MSPTTTVITLQNERWQVGILPQTGASIAYGRVRHSDQWVDLLRPTDPADYGNSSSTSSFIMLPWCNRIRGGLFPFRGQTYQLDVAADEQVARHGDVRNRAWVVAESTPTRARLTFDSADHEGVNFPFRFAASVEYALNDAEFSARLTLTNTGDQPFPAGFGFHPYFVRPAIDIPLIKIDCAGWYRLVDLMAADAAVDVPDHADYRVLRPVTDGLNDVLTRCSDAPIELHYPAYNLNVEMMLDPLFGHVLIYSHPNGDTVAVEPMTHVSNAFNLDAQGVPDTGTFVLEAGASHSAAMRLGV